MLCVQSHSQTLDQHPAGLMLVCLAHSAQSIGLYDCSAASRLRNYTPSRAPVFDVAWGPASSTKIYSGGLDRSVIECVPVALFSS